MKLCLVIMATVYINGNRIGTIEKDGDIYRSGSHWGTAEKCCSTSEAIRRTAAAVLLFAGDFR